MKYIEVTEEEINLLEYYVSKLDKSEDKVTMCFALIRGLKKNLKEDIEKERMKNAIKFFEQMFNYEPDTFVITMEALKGVQEGVQGDNNEKT